jgi:hypothetical protein
VSLDASTLRQVGERTFNVALVVFVGAVGGDAANLFSLDWPHIGAAVVGAAVLEAARGLISATGGDGTPSTTGLVRRALRLKKKEPEHPDGPEPSAKVE